MKIPIRNIPIKKQLIIVTIISTIVPLVAISVLFFIFGNKMVIDRSKDIHMDKMLLIDYALTLYIEKTKHTVNTIATNPLIVDLNTIEIVTYRHWANWNEMKPYQNSKAEQNVYDYLKLIHLNNPDISFLNIGTDSGKFVMYPTSNRMPFYDPSKRIWYKDAKDSNGVITVTSPFISSDKDFQVFGVAKHIYFEKSKEFGVVCASIELSTIAGIMSNLNPGKGSYIVLTTEDNTILVNTRDPLYAFQNLNTSEDLPQFYSKLPKMKNNWETINTDDHNKYLVKKMQSLGTNWILYAFIDKDVALASFNNIFKILILCCLLIVAVFCPIIIKHIIYILIPLKKLSSHIFSLAKGEGEALQKKIFLNSPDEIGETIENYNLLLESLNNIFLKISEGKQLISSGNSKLSNQMLIISADIIKTLSLIENTDKKTSEIDNVYKNFAADIVEIKKTPETKKKKDNLTERINKGKEEFNNCSKSITEYISDIKKILLDMNVHIDKGVEYNRFILNELSNIGKIIYVYKLRSPEKISEDQENKKRKKD